MKNLLIAFALLCFEVGAAGKFDFFEPTVVPTPVKAVAGDSGVMLVPQLNVFGHASLTSVRTGNHAALNVSPEYEPIFEPYSGWNWCLSSPAARQMIKDLMVELHDLFGRPPYFHIGCDEGCPPTWPDCRVCRRT